MAVTGLVLIIAALLKQGQTERAGQAPDYVDACGMCLWEALHWNVPHSCFRSLAVIVHVIVS